MSSWAIDVGTTNTGVACWDEEAGRPRLVELPDICRQPGADDPLEAPRLVPSTTHALEDLGFWAKVGRWKLFARRFFWGHLAIIGRPAIEMNATRTHPEFSRSFKRQLANEALRPVARLGKRTLTARDVARLYLRELLHEIKSTTGERIRDLVVTAPVDSYEAYRAELGTVFGRLGVRRIRFIDEPVAAALGYGLSLRQHRIVLVVDFGGGTLDIALVSMRAKDVRSGSCKVLAKDGRAIGGNLVDRWLLAEFCDRLDYPLREDAKDELTGFWYRLMLREACRVKESVFFKDQDTFYLTPPDELRSFEARIRGEVSPLEVDQDFIVEVLKKHDLYDTLDGCVESVLAQAREQGVGQDDIDDVLMVGGSTLLPNVYQMFHDRFGRDRVRAWQPFEAVAYGAAAFSADSFTQSDFIVHDYAVVTYHPKTHEPEYTVIVPKGTRFPTPEPIWTRKMVPTCSLGLPEEMFKLVICEIGQNVGERKFGWDASGKIHKLGGKQASGSSDDRLIVPLNESNPTLGYLKPPHQPNDRRPRLEITFGINDNRWLSASVLDLFTNKFLMKDETVVRLL